jgi:hypothetical protein
MPLRVNIVDPSTYFSNICNSCTSIKIRDQVPQPYKTNGKIMFSFISPQASIPAPAAKKVIPFLAYFPKIKVGLSNHESVCPPLITAW